MVKTKTLSKHKLDMKKSHLLGLVIIFFFFLNACSSSEKRRETRAIYMADMFKSRAYQSQTNDPFFISKVGNKRPKGVIARGEVVDYTLPNTNEAYVLSAGVKNPLANETLDAEAAKALYITFCATCHGNQLDGNGYLYRDGEGPYIAKPANLVGDVKYTSMSEGTMFHSIFYGKNLMGSYSSQLTQKEIWMLVSYIKAQQAKNKK